MYKVFFSIKLVPIPDEKKGSKKYKPHYCLTYSHKNSLHLMPRLKPLNNIKKHLIIVTEE